MIRPHDRNHRGPHRRLPRLAAELGFAAMTAGSRAELLPGSPATIAVNRHGKLLALLVVGDEATARKILNLPPQLPRDFGADALWERERRDHDAADQLLPEAC